MNDGFRQEDLWQITVTCTKFITASEIKNLTKSMDVN